MTDTTTTQTQTRTVRYGAELNSKVIKYASLEIEQGKRTGTVEITFNTGNKYRYEDVPEMVFLGLLHSESHGEYFNTHIKSAYGFYKETGN